MLHNGSFEEKEIAMAPRKRKIPTPRLSVVQDAHWPIAQWYHSSHITFAAASLTKLSDIFDSTEEACRV
jgi:hypothetical protein